MAVQIPYSIYTKIQKKSNIRTVQGKHRKNTAAVVQLQRRGNHRRTSDERPYPHASEHTTKVQRVEFMGYLKGKSSLMIFDRHANLKYKFGNRHFWAEGYYVSTVGMNEATIAKYIREQEAHDIAMDKITEKEHDDPFKGGR